MAFKYDGCTIFRGTDCDTDYYLAAAEVMEKQ
jgi:hypothetical protein